MKKLYELKDSLCEKLEEYADKEVTTSTLEIMEALSTTVKNLAKIIAMDEEEYSNRRYSRTYGSYSDGSYRRGRDSMGRYARDEYARDEMRGMVDEMRNLANTLPSNQRTDIDRLIRKMEQM